MSRENLLFAIIGILLGFIVGFMLASSMSQKQASPLAASSQGLPADHPPLGAQNAEMAQGGVSMMAGTDGPLSQAGTGLHDELEMLIKAGLTPMQVLQSATRNPAEYMDRLRELGTIERGKIADLVLLDADPLVDIANARRVSVVILGGQIVSRIQPQPSPRPSMIPRIQQ